MAAKEKNTLENKRILKRGRDDMKAKNGNELMGYKKAINAIQNCLPTFFFTRCFKKLDTSTNKK